MQRLERARLADGVVAAEQELRLAPDRSAEVLELEAIRVDSFNLDAHDALRVVDAEAEGAADEPQLPDRAGGDEPAHARRLRVVAVHEPLAEQPACPFRGVEPGYDLVGIPSERFLAEHVLAGLERPDR